MRNKDVVKKIKEAVRNSGYTQDEFAKKIRIGRTMISQWAGGVSSPSLKSLKKIAKATGKPLNFFLDNSTGSNNTIGSGSNAVSEINNVQIGEISSKKDTKIELLEKEIENLKLKLEIEQLKNGRRDKKKDTGQK